MVHDNQNDFHLKSSEEKWSFTWFMSTFDDVLRITVRGSFIVKIMLLSTSDYKLIQWIPVEVSDRFVDINNASNG